MSTGSIGTRSTPRPEPPLPLAWRSWPLVDDLPWTAAARSGGRTAVWAGLVPWGLLAFAVGITYWAAPHPWWALAALAAILTTLWRWLVPVFFEVNSQGLTRTVLGRRRRIPWRAVGHYEVHAGGVFFLPAGEPTLMDRLRGIYVPMDPKRRLPEVVRYYLDPWLVD